MFMWQFPQTLQNNRFITNEHAFMQKLSLIYHFANLMTNEPQVTYSNQNANYVSLEVLVGLYPSSNSYKLVKINPRYVVM